MKAILVAALLLAITGPCLAKDCAMNLVRHACASCHAQRATPLQELHLTRQQWQEAVERMAAYGVAIPDEKLQELLDYLAQAYGTRPRGTGIPIRPTTQGRNNP